MQSLIAVIFREDMDRAEAYRVELRGREELAGLVDCSKMVAAVCDKEGKVHLQYTHALAKDGALIGGVWGALIGFLFLNPVLGIFAGDNEALAGLAIPLPGGGDLMLGSFLNAILSFLIMAFVVFCIVKLLNRLHKKEEAAPPPPPKPSAEEALLTEIRDLLKEQKNG